MFPIEWQKIIFQTTNIHQPDIILFTKSLPPLHPPRHLGQLPPRSAAPRCRVGSPPPGVAPLWPRRSALPREPPSWACGRCWRHRHPRADGPESIEQGHQVEVGEHHWRKPMKNKATGWLAALVRVTKFILGVLRLKQKMLVFARLVQEGCWHRHSFRLAGVWLQSENCCFTCAVMRFLCSRGKKKH